MARADEIEVRARGYNYFLERKIAMRWPSPFRAWFPDSTDATEMLDWHWRFFQFVFPLTDPAKFPALGDAAWTEDERQRLRRYLRHAHDLAETSALSTKSGYTVSVPTPDAPWEIEQRDMVAKDATVGFLTMVRQCYSPDENASFKRVYDLVSREAYLRRVDRETMRAWKGAHNRMRGQHLDYLILKRAGELDLLHKHVASESGSSPERAENSPEQMLSNVFYGDAIHWGKHRTVVDSWDAEHEFWAMKRRWDALRAAVQFGHLYVGFAAVVGRATGELDPADI